MSSDQTIAVTDKTLPPSTLEVELSRLMRRALAGEQSSYRSLLEKLAVLLRAGLRDAQDDAPAHALEDHVQQTLLAVHLKRHTYNTEHPFLPWLQALAHYQTKNTLRLDDAFLVTTTDDGSDHSGTTDLTPLLHALPPAQRETLDLMLRQDLTAQQAAENNGQSLAAVKTGIHAFLALLARPKKHLA